MSKKEGANAASNATTRELCPAALVRAQTANADRRIRNNIPKLRSLRLALERKNKLRKKAEQIGNVQKRRTEAVLLLMNCLNDIETMRSDTKKFKTQINNAMKQAESILRREEATLEEITSLKKEIDEEHERTHELFNEVLANTTRLGKSSAVYPGTSLLNVFTNPCIDGTEITLQKRIQPQEHQ